MAFSQPCDASKKRVKYISDTLSNKIDEAINRWIESQPPGTKIVDIEMQPRNSYRPSCGYAALVSFLPPVKGKG